MTVSVEPSEVLAHLNRMGFCGVTTEQLREFITDLKKLIKYDLQQCSCDRGKSPGQRESETDTTQSLHSLCVFPRSGDTVDFQTHHHHSEVSSASQSSQTDGCSLSAYGHSGVLSTSGYSVQGHVRQVKSSGDVKLSSQNKRTENHKETRRPRSSFIKPWRLQTTTTQRRSDPVALYHKYQALWQQQKVPGDDGHTDLRWNIRERMLGDPQPQPISHTLSMERCSRHHRTSQSYI